MRARNPGVQLRYHGYAVSFISSMKLNVAIIISNYTGKAPQNSELSIIK